MAESVSDFGLATASLEQLAEEILRRCRNAVIVISEEVPGQETDAAEFYQLWQKHGLWDAVGLCRYVEDKARRMRYQHELEED